VSCLSCLGDAARVLCVGVCARAAHPLHTPAFAPLPRLSRRNLHAHAPTLSNVLSSQKTGHCKRLAPTWDELATAINADAALTPADGPGFKVAHVDCTTDKSVCASQEVKGYPTLKVVHKGEAVEAYRGARDLEALKTFAAETHKKLTSEM